VRTIDGVTVVQFVDSKVVIEAGDQLTRLVDVDGHRRLLLNFENIRFLSSAGLAVLVSLKRKVDAAGGTLKFCCANPDLLELFRITRLDLLFAIHENEPGALETF
jgi:anti-sigma B factor antagonist